MNSKKSTANDRTNQFFDGIVRIAEFLLGTSFRGLRQFFVGWVPYSYFIIFIWIWTSTILVLWNYKHLKLLNYFFSDIFTAYTIDFLITTVPYPLIIHTVILVFIPFGFFGFLYGLFVKDLRKEANEALKHLGFKTALDKPPKVAKVIPLDDFRRKILISSIGIGLDKYIARKSDFEMSLRSTIESIRTTPNNKYIEVFATNRIIPTMLSYRNCLSLLSEPLTFPIGESLGGIVNQSLATLPHMMIAGTTGGGKSNFFKQTILTLIKTTPRIQVYLLDLKRGVETMAFAGLPNVSIAQTETEANILLAKLKDEMNHRFDIIKKSGRTSLDPELDKKDVIVIAVDEASVLYGKTKVSKSRSKSATQARELTDDLAKLGRAARMHLILATQKVTTESIDTKIQENIGGRICFRANTLQGSMTVLGNKMAHELPDIKGRAIWSNGTTFIEVQTPFISDKILADEIFEIANDFKNGKRQTFDTPFTVKAVIDGEDETKSGE